MTTIPVLGVFRGVLAGVAAGIGACIVALAASLPWLAMVVLAVVLTYVVIVARRALSMSGANATSATAAAHTPPSKGRWVIVDDDDSVRSVIEAAARRLGLETVSFAEPRRALAAISVGGAPLGIITDYEMPEMTGIQLAERVRAAGISCPILLVSGSTSFALDECRAIDGMLEKPFTMAQLVQCIDRAIERNSGTKAEARE